MKAITIAAAGAAVIGSVHASGHAEHVHAKLHANVARDSWVDWNSTAVDPAPETTTTTKKPVVDPATTTSESDPDSTWVDWSSTGTTPVDPATPTTTTTTTTTSVEHTWSDWCGPTETTTVDGTETKTITVYPEGCTTTEDPVTTTTTTTTSVEHTWADWCGPTETTTVDGTETKTITVYPEGCTTTEDPVTTTTTTTTSAEHTWADWCGPTETTTVDGTETKTITVYPEGCTTTEDPVTTTTTTTSAHTWGDWTTSTTPVVDPATTTSVEHTWGDWPKDPETSVDPETPVDGPSTDPAHTWSDWVAEPTTTVVLTKTSTETVYVDPVTETSHWVDWSSTTDAVLSTETPVDAGECVVSVITSYGAPTWYPTPVVDPVTSSTWADWCGPTETTTVDGTETKTITVFPEGCTTTEDAVTTTTTTSAEHTWADWCGPTETTTVDGTETKTITVFPEGCTTTEDPVTTTTTTTSAHTWGDWTSTTTPVVDPVDPETSTWADWTSTTTIPVDPVDPATSTWADWTSTTTIPVDPVDPETSTWAEWTSAVPAPSGSAPITSKGDKWAITYSPFSNNHGCKDTDTIAKDFALIAAKGFTSVRVYSTECEVLTNFGNAARANGLKLILGVWVPIEGVSGAQKQVEEIVAWAQWDLVELIVVGNEVVYKGWLSAAELAAFVKASSDAFKAAKYTGLVTTTEPLNIWEVPANAAAFCSVVDVVGANLYAFFNPTITADKAGGFIQAQIDILNGICGDAQKPVYVLESGWPHAGQCNGAACPSPENQATALTGIKNAVGAKVTFLSFEDEGWKDAGPYGVEQYWGCAGVF